MHIQLVHILNCKKYFLMFFTLLKQSSKILNIIQRHHPNVFFFHKFGQINVKAE